MSTRSYIGLERAQDRSVVYSYCHHDGYLEHNGVLLLLFHNDYRAANKLASSYGMSGLGIDYLNVDEWRTRLVAATCLSLAPTTEFYSVVAGTPPNGADSVEQMDTQEYTYVFAAKHNAWFVRCEESGYVFVPLLPLVKRHVSRWPAIEGVYRQLQAEGFL